MSAHNPHHWSSIPSHSVPSSLATPFPLGFVLFLHPLHLRLLNPQHLLHRFHLNSGCFPLSKHLVMLLTPRPLIWLLSSSPDSTLTPMSCSSLDPLALNVGLSPFCPSGHPVLCTSASPLLAMPHSATRWGSC